MCTALPGGHPSDCPKNAGLAPRLRAAVRRLRLWSRWCGRAARSRLAMWAKLRRRLNPVLLSVLLALMVLLTCAWTWWYGVSERRGRGGRAPEAIARRFGGFAGNTTAATSMTQLQRQLAEMNATLIARTVELASVRQMLETDRAGQRPTDTITDPYAYCHTVPLYIDPVRQRQRQERARHQERPLVSIVYTTRRPGGYDILFNSLAIQTHRDYELIIIDEMHGYRASKIWAWAAARNIPLVHVSGSKPKHPKYMNTRFGLYNALNTGVLLARGRIFVSLMDNNWLMPNFIESIVNFYADPQHATHLLSTPERWWVLEDAYKPNRTVVDQEDRMSLFEPEWNWAPSTDRRRMHPSFCKPQEDRFPDHTKRIEAVFEEWLRRDPPHAGNIAAEAYRQALADKQLPPHQLLHQPGEWTTWVFFEFNVAALPFKAFELLNGLEEYLDVGDDCHEANLRMRMELLGWTTWANGHTMTQGIYHKNWGNAPTPMGDGDPIYDRENPQWHVSNWQRFAWEEMADIKFGRRPLQSKNGFDLRRWRQLDCPVHLI
ncbi:hypothetical protein CDCA_CDCA06G1852 [Cyanidium caldarium]|uniref:Uncharacterized protein n=1 Tax=Cyanidium caldarium TaxID=2771 RepID=A0AAV9IU43_CYACA|nr:hypothetical protein CDCA_CDCA06G1852 [Cyanidium caldarium]